MLIGGLDMLEPEEIQDIIKRFKVNGEDDNCRFKEIIKQRLLNNRAIIDFLNSPNLDEDCPDDYFGVVIKPEYMIPQTQSEYKNFICFETAWDGSMPRYGSDKMKLSTITFYILCEEEGNVDKETGLARHDLLAALIKQEFSNSNFFGCKLEHTKDTPSTTDTHYATRAIEFTIHSLVEGNIKTCGDRMRNMSNCVRC